MFIKRAQIALVNESSEENMLFLDLLRRRKINAEISVFQEAESFLNHLLDANDKDIPDLLICALALPGMSGNQLVKKIQKNAKYKKTLCVLLTDLSQENILFQNTQNIAYISKPLTTQLLTKIIDTHPNLEITHSQNGRVIQAYRDVS